MEIETEKKLMKRMIEFTIDGVSVKMPATEAFFIWRAVTCYAQHTKLKNYFKRVMDKQLEEVK